MDSSSSPLNSIGNQSFYSKIRDPRLKANISAADFLDANNRIGKSDRFLHIVDDYSKRIEEYGTRLQISTATISNALSGILTAYPNSTFTYDELFNYLLEALDNKNLLNKSPSGREALPSSDKTTAFRDEYMAVPRYRDFSKQINMVSAPVAGRDSERNLALPSRDFDMSLFSRNVSSNKEFASWLLASPPALASMMTKRDYTTLLSAMMNKNILDQSSPLFLAQMGGLLAQILKLKQGKPKSSAGIEEEEKAEELKQIDKISSAEHSHTIVDSVKDVINTIPIKSLKDFLLEAERFVEEEIALFYSIQKSIEKEILNQVKKKVNKKKES